MNKATFWSLLFCSWPD